MDALHGRPQLVLELLAEQRLLERVRTHLSHFHTLVARERGAQLVFVHWSGPQPLLFLDDGCILRHDGGRDDGVGATHLVSRLRRALKAFINPFGLLIWFTLTADL